MTSREILETTGYFCEASAELQSAILSASNRLRFKAGMLLFEMGSSSPPFAIIGSGIVRVFQVGETGREITLYRVTSGEMCLLNMLSAYLDVSPAANAVAETDGEVALIDAAVFRRWVEMSPSFHRHVFHSIAMRVGDLLTLLEQVAFGRLDTRLANFLRERRPLEGTSPPLVNITHQEIAAELGTAREVVTRLLHDLQRRGAVEVMRGRIRLLDESRLIESAVMEKHEAHRGPV